MPPMPDKGSEAAPMLTVRNLQVVFPSGERRLGRRPRTFRAVDDVSLDIDEGDTIGVVGESGSGKSTLGRAILGLAPIASGEVRLRGQDIRSIRPAERMQFRRMIQCIFQDPYSSLSPSHTVEFTLREPLIIHGLAAGAAQVDALLDLVGLSTHMKSRRPSELSGGQCQRVAIARALALTPKLVICDEPTSALDVSVQAQIVALLKDFAARMRLSYLFISHDLAVVQQVARRVMVMFGGRIVEDGSTQDIFAAPSHPYTAALLSAVPIPDPAQDRSRKRLTLSDDNAEMPASGCRFRSRCWLWRQLGEPEICCNVDPQLPTETSTHRSACHFSREVGEKFTTTMEAKHR